MSELRVGLFDDLGASMTTTHRVLVLLAVGAALGFGAGELAHHFQRQAALELVEVEKKAAAAEAARRVALEAERDSAAAELAAELVELRQDSVRTAGVLRSSSQAVEVATVRADAFADSVRVRVDSATAVFLDAHLAEDLVKEVAFARQVGVLTDENVRLWGTVRSLEQLVDDGKEVETSLRAELALQEAIVRAQARALDPPFSVELFNDAKVAVPALLVGYGIGVVTSG